MTAARPKSTETCGACRRPGGALYELSAKVAVLADDAKAASIATAERRGSNRVWGILRTAAGAVALVVLGFALDHCSAKRSAETRQIQAQETAKVTEKIQRVEDVAKAMAPVGLFSPLLGGK